MTECPAKPVAHLTDPAQMRRVPLNRPRDTAAQARAQRELLLRTRRRRSAPVRSRTQGVLLGGVAVLGGASSGVAYLSAEDVNWGVSNHQLQQQKDRAGRGDHVRDRLRGHPSTFTFDRPVVSLPSDC